MLAVALLLAVLGRAAPLPGMRGGGTGSNTAHTLAMSGNYAM